MPRDVPISKLKSLSEYQVELFNAKKEVFTLEDLLVYYPIRYEDRSSSLSLGDAFQKQFREESYVPTVIAQCLEKKEISFQMRRVPQFTFSDGKNPFYVTAFSPYHRYLKEGAYYILTGKLKKTGHKWVMNLIEYEIFDEEAVQSLNTGRIVPIYSSTEGLYQKKIRVTIANVLRHHAHLDIRYSLPGYLVKKYNLKDKIDNLYQMHFPESKDSLEKARNELAYEELFSFQYRMALSKMEAKKGKEVGRYPKDITADIVEKRLPFQLTSGQREALEEIKKDLRSAYVMTRLIQGDVGSGKTVVAMLSMLLAYDNQHQSVLLAPTDILARQHHRFFFELLFPLGINAVLLVGKMGTKEKKESLRQIRSGEAHMIIGTHSMFQEEVSYFNLRYIIIDEQHRFGVEQRQVLLNKGHHPDFLMMSATPIPRSLSMTIFGDLDITNIKELPAGRQTRYTKVLPEKERAHAYQFLLSRIKKGEQGYIIFPTIEEERKTGVKALLKEYQSIKKEFFPSIPMGIVHGKLKDDEKQTTMNLFFKGEIKILFATTVLEVGIDNPNATTILIESAEHFGLAQLHQLRGRVGRGEKQGYCYLITADVPNPQVQEKLRRFCNTDSGFEIAELDLQLRGPGEFFGTKQTGSLKFKIADVIRDYPILKKAKEDAQNHVVESQGSPSDSFFH